MIGAPEAMWIIQGQQEAIVKAAHMPATGELLDAWSAFRQPARVHLQALAGLGQQLLDMGDEAIDAWHARLRDAPFLDRYATIRRALLSNVWLELPHQIAEVFVQEASEVLESAPARLVSVRMVVAARRVHIVTDDEKSQCVFLRAIDYGGGGGPLEIQSNVTGAVIERDPIGTLSRKMLAQCGWKLLPGWWIVQPSSQRAENGESARLRRPSPKPGGEPPKPLDETPKSTEAKPQPR
jgi:hypothetical protein